MAMAMAMAVGVRVRPASKLFVTTRRPNWVFTPLALSSSSSSKPSRKLILYSKPGCCLCDGLKEKLQAAFSLSAPDSLNDVDLEIRDITLNPCWEKSYQYEIPVLAKVHSDGTETDLYPVDVSAILRAYENYSPAQETLPRLSPRLEVELVHKKIAAALKELD